MSYIKVWLNKDLSIALNLSTKLEGGAIKINSQLIENGDIFIALDNGPAHDGHNYVIHALEMGANFCIVNKSSNIDFSQHLNKIIKVEDTKKCLAEMAQYKRQTTKAYIIAVTGSVGKTTTKNLIGDLILAQVQGQDKVFASYKNFNNLLGTQINLASMPQDALYGVFEVGMQQKGEIDEIVKLLKPKIALITNIGPVHLEYFDNVEGIADAKCEIFNYMDLNDILILNDNSPYSEYIKNKARKKGLKICTYGTNKDCNLTLLETNFNYNKLSARLALDNQELKLETTFLSSGGIYNILGAILCIHILRLGVDQVLNVIQSLNPYENRGEMINVESKQIKILDFSYNANPISVTNNLAALLYNNNVKRKVLIFADMLELGKDQENYHTSLLPALIQYKVDKLITVGKLSRLLYNAAPESMKLAYFDDSDELKEHIKDLINPHDLVMIQGSFGMKLKKVVDFLQN